MLPTRSSSSDVSACLRVLIFMVAATAVFTWAAITSQNAAAAVSCPTPTSGVPAINLSKSAPADVLYAEPIPITLTASQPTAPPGDPEWGFNLTYRDVLPPGVSYVSGSAPVAPQEITDQPAPGWTTLIFSNVGDLAPGSSHTLTYEAQYTTTDYAVGDLVATGSAGPPAAAAAYVNCNPRWLPRFDSAGLPTGTPADSASSSASAAPSSTLLKAIEIEKSEPSPEHELLRGVHDNKTAYTLTVRNNTENATNGVDIVDYLPPGLEFLGCGDVDNTTEAPSNPGSSNEYPGSGSIAAGANPGLANCFDPISVEFGTFDPDGILGPLPSGPYTRVEWDLGVAGDLAPGATYSLDYVAAIPICPNTTTWSGGSPPSAGSLAQSANLDNNSCAVAGTETTDETALTNYAVAGGTYADPGGDIPASDVTSLTVTAEDLAIWKEALTPNFAVGSTIRWRLHVLTSEYRTFENTLISDVAPDGTCPVVGSNPPSDPSADTPCAATGNALDQPNPVWLTTTENGDGTWTLGWDLGQLDSNEETVVDFATMVREHYQESGADASPVLVGDSLTNDVDIEGDSYPICSVDPGGVIPCVGPTPPYIEHTETPGTTLDDDSSATVGSGRPTLDKQVATPASLLPAPVDCSELGGAVYQQTTATGYRPGDLICWKIRVNFPATISTGGVTLTDFLPAGTQYVPGIAGTGLTPASDPFTVTLTDNGSFLDFNLNLVGDTVQPGGYVFEYTFATRVDNNGFPGSELPPLRGNLLKLSTANTAGSVVTYRDDAEAEVASPELAVTKGVKRIANSPFLGQGPDVDGGTIVPGSSVEYRVDVSNSGLTEAVDARVSERLIGPYDCTMVDTPIPNGGGCDDSTPGLTVITWIGVTVPASDGVNDGKNELNFSVYYPDTIAPMVQIDDRACVDWFENETNDPLNPRYKWEVGNDPADCGSPTLPGVPDQTLEDPITDTSYVTAPGSVAKNATTSVDETNNNLGSQATIGEEIQYDVGLEIPNRTTITSLQISDVIQTPSQQVYLSGNCASTESALCTGATVTYNGGTGTVTMTRSGSWTNNTGSTQFVWLIFTVRVADVPANVAGAGFANTATVRYTDQYSNPFSKLTNTTNVTVVEPNPQIAKADDDADNIVSPDQEVEYTLTVTNPARTSPTRAASISHETDVTDEVPEGLTPTDGSGTAISDGGTVVRCDGSPGGGTGIWNSGTRKITWTLGDIAPASTTTLRYCAEVDSSPAPGAGSTLENTATVSGTSMPGVDANERSYSDQDSDTLTVTGSTLSKVASPTSATIGQKVQYTVTVTLPGLTDFYLYRVNDTLPAGMSLDSFDSVACTGDAVGCAAMAPLPSGMANDQDLEWDFNDIAAAATSRTLTITYTAVVEDVVGNQQGTVLTNSATNSWCTIVTEVCIDPYGYTSPPVTKDVTVTEPNLSIDKDVDCQTGDDDSCDIQPGDSFSYSITVTNNGDTTAYDAIFQDQVPSTLTNVIVGGLPGGVTAVSPDPPNTHAWMIDSLAPNTSVTITYTADLVASSSLNNPYSAVNTASITQYWGLDDADRTGNTEAREYPEGADPTDTVTLTGHLPQPQVVKTVANSGNAEIDQCLTWTLTISNASAVADLNDIEVVDTLPAGWTYCALSGSPADPDDISGQVLTWDNVGDIAGGGPNIVVTFAARPTMAALDNSGEPTNPYVNNVSITGKDASGAGGHDTPIFPYADSDSEDANIQMPNLSIAKTPDADTVLAGTWNNWTITITNSGLGTARDVAIRDEVPSGLAFDLTAHPASAVCAPLPPCDTFTRTSLADSGTGPQDITWTLASLAPGETITLTLPMFVDPDVVSGTNYTNTAYVASTERPTEINDPGQWTTDRSADMAIVKSDENATGTAGENVTYALSVSNGGPSSANNVQVTDTIDTNVFEFVSITPDGPGDSCSTTGAPVVTGISCDVSGALAPGDSRDFTLVLKIKSGVTDPVSNTASVTADEPDPDTDNNSDTETTPVGITTSLTIDKVVSTGSPSTILNHDETKFTVTVSNAGPSDAIDVPVRDTLPAGLSCVSVTVYTPTGCDGDAGDVVTLTIDSIPAGESRSFELTVRGEVVGLQTNTAAVDINGGDSAEADVTVDPMADLLIYKDGPEAVPSDFDFDFDLTVQNLGPDAAATPHITDTLPAGLIYVGYTAPIGTTCSISGQLFTCDLPDMPNGAEIIINVHVNSGFAFSEGAIENSASVSSTTPDSDPSNNEGDDSVMVGPNADVAITKTGPAFGAEGWPLTYVLSVVNNGPAMAEFVHVNDVLPAGLTFGSVSTNVGTCSESNGTIDCGLGDMNPGDTAQITIIVTPTASLVGTTITNTAEVNSETPDGVMSNNTSTVTTPIENNQYPTSSNVTLTKTASDSAPQVGDLITYTLTATNHGPDTARSVALTDTLPGGLLFTSVAGDGQCTFTSPTLTCQLGDIPAGQSRTVTVQAYVVRSGSTVNNGVVTAANDRDPSDNTAISPIVAAKSSARLKLTKSASKKTVKVGSKAKFKIKVKNVSKVNAVDVEVCDLIPSRLSVVRRDGGYLKSGNLCWKIPLLRAGRTSTFKPTFRVANGSGTSVTNPARARAYNAKTVRAKAKIRVPARAAKAGGTTG
jgi:uncharacterized repeat protein (TIGR01451 family)/fimbrial isopeptide formation D2 family protein